MIVQDDAVVYQQLRQLATRQRLVFFAGLPGTGKSLLSHQLTHLAVAAGRIVHLLQWDMARPVFEAHPYGQRYPVVDGVTHGVIRIAVSRWARLALLQWEREHSDPAHLLIGETPFIGHRFMDLAWRLPDAAEEVLQHASVFVLPVPSAPVRHYIEMERQRRSIHPVHPQEREDAPPQVLQALWQELARLAPHFGLAQPVGDLPVPYDPALYQAIYTCLLKHRQVCVLPMHTRLPTAQVSVYDFAVKYLPLLPGPADVLRCIQAVEQAYPDAMVLQHALTQWYLV